VVTRVRRKDGSRMRMGVERRISVRADMAVGPYGDDRWCTWHQLRGTGEGLLVSVRLETSSGPLSISGNGRAVCSLPA
jgi:hypothetical protein